MVKTRATLTVHGPRQLVRAFRKRMIDELKEDASEVKLTEVQSETGLEFTLDAPHGVPFPVLINVSIQYPDCVAMVRWVQECSEGETTIQNGQVKEASRTGTAAGARLPLEVRVANDGSLCLLLAFDLAPEGIIGFCATCDAETYFKLSRNSASPALWTIGGTTMQWDEMWQSSTENADAMAVAQDKPLALTGDEQRTLDRFAAAVRAEWLWYAHAPDEETIVERQRYAEAQRPVCAINVKSRKYLEQSDAKPTAGSATPASGQRWMSSLAADQRWIADFLENTWAQPVSLDHE